MIKLAKTPVLLRALLLCSIGLFLTETANAAAPVVPTQTTTLEMQQLRSVQSGTQKVYSAMSEPIVLPSSNAFAVQWKTNTRLGNMKTTLLLTKKNGDVVEKKVTLEEHSNAKNGKNTGNHVSELMFVSKDYTHAAVRFDYTGVQQSVSNVKLTAMDTREGASTQSRGATSMVQPGSVKSTKDKVPKKTLKGTNVQFVARSYWLSSKKSINKSDWKPQYKRPKRIIVHHTAGQQVKGEEYIRGIWNYHTNVLGWGDIGYNFIIGPGGVIYKGRDGVLSKEKTPVAAHTYNEALAINFNRGSIGIALVGCFDASCDKRDRVTPRQKKSLDRLVKGLSKKYRINPFEEGVYKGYTGPNLGSHRDYDATVCPGGRAYKRVGSLRKRLTAWYPYADESDRVLTSK